MAIGGNLVFRFLGDKSSLDRSVRASRTSIGGLVNFAKTALPQIGAAFAAAYSVRAAETQDLAEKKLAATLKATGNAAGFSARQIQELASARQQITNFGDETTIDAAGILATFKQIQGQGFEKTLTLAQDVSAVMGTDLRSSVTQLGKALNDPIRGMSQLTRVGITFNDQQREQIRLLQSSGDLLGAQRIILTELESEFGGAAEAMASPLQQLQNDLGDVAEDIGALLMPAVHAMAKGFHSLKTAIEDSTQEFLIFIGAADEFRNLEPAKFRLLPSFKESFKTQFEADRRQSIKDLASLSGDLGGQAFQTAQRAASGRTSIFRGPIDVNRTTTTGQLATLQDQLAVVTESFADTRSEAEIFRETLHHISTIQAFGNLTGDQATGLAAVKAGLQNAIDETSGANDLISKMQDEIAAIRSDPIDVLIDKLDAAGVSIEKITMISDLAREKVDALADAKLREEKASLREEIAVLRGTKQIDEELSSLRQEKQDVLDAARIKESIRTPLERASERIAQIDRLQKAGEITTSEGRDALRQAAHDFQNSLPDIGQPAGPARAVDLFSHEGVDLFARAVTGTGRHDKLTEQVKLSERQVELSEGQQKTLDRIESILSDGSGVTIKAPGAV